MKQAQCRGLTSLRGVESAGQDCVLHEGLDEFSSVLRATTNIE
jgi:hypothetical protein